jgi:hypothetical protein
VCDFNENCNLDCPICGDGYCNQGAGEDQSSCFKDCYYLYTSKCNDLSDAEKVRPLGPGMPTRDDTFGNLINNQVLWRFPGIEHLQVIEFCFKFAG